MVVNEGYGYADVNFQNGGETGAGSRMFAVNTWESVKDWLRSKSSGSSTAVDDTTVTLEV